MDTKMDQQAEPMLDIEHATTSRDIDESVAELIFGEEYDHVDEIPAFTRSMSFAMLVRDEIFKWGYACRHRFLRRLQELVTAEFPDAFRDPELVIHMDEVVMRMQPKHICVAAIEIAAELQNEV